MQAANAIIAMAAGMVITWRIIAEVRAGADVGAAAVARLPRGVSTTTYTRCLSAGVGNLAKFVMPARQTPRIEGCSIIIATRHHVVIIPTLFAC